jgi:hypothetical protein
MEKLKGIVLIAVITFLIIISRNAAEIKLLAFVILSGIMMTIRIYRLVEETSAKSSERKNLRINLLIALAYSVLFWSPVISEKRSRIIWDLPVLDFTSIFITLWLVVLFLHVIIIWSNLEFNRKPGLTPIDPKN